MKTLTFIRDSLRNYGGIYYLNKTNNECKQLTNVPGIEHLRPIDILNNTQLTKANEDEPKNIFERAVANKPKFENKIFGDKSIAIGGTTNYQRFYGSE
ncbi:MAG: hypothetical protein HUJ68_06700 [Clostridia bacterium]|nr:hypothetical protein [Clostridia bacterium]